MIAQTRSSLTSLSLLTQRRGSTLFMTSRCSSYRIWHTYMN